MVLPFNVEAELPNWVVRLFYWKERGIVMKTVVTVSIVLVFLGLAYGEETYTITGEVSFQYDGDIYVCICNLEEWTEILRPRHEFSDSKCNFIAMNNELQKAGATPFKLEGITKGTYVIVGYQDNNKNGMVDYENYILNEPWQTYKESSTNQPMWNQIKFDLEKDLAGIKIQM